jgi:hypothetical protein
MPAPRPPITNPETGETSEAGVFTEISEIGGRAFDTLVGIDVEDPTGLEQSSYDFNYRVFPEDLAMSDSSHYMVININVPVYRKTGQNRSSYDPGTILSNEFSKVDNLRFGNISSPFTGRPLPDATNAEYFSIPRNTRRIKESIALHMPNGGLVYTEDNTYEPVSMTAMAGQLVGAAGKLGGTAGGAAASLATATGQVLKNGGKLAGYPINPRVEVLFATRPQRQWMFEVFLAPRSKSESETANRIIQTLRYHAAPELGTGGFYFIPPAEFDITFFRQGVENLNLPRINTCVLERIDIDFAPQSGVYSTFLDGSPVAIRLSLGFREIEILHKRRVLQGF